MFLTYNKPWLRDNTQEVFTPRTIFMHRERIIDEFGKILGPLDPNITLTAKKSETDSLEVAASRSSQINSSDVSLESEGVDKDDPRFAGRLEAKIANARMQRRIK